MDATASAERRGTGDRRRLPVAFLVLAVFLAAASALDLILGRRGLAPLGTLCVAAGVIPSFVRLYRRKEQEHVPLAVLLLQMVLLVAGLTLTIVAMAGR